MLLIDCLFLLPLFKGRSVFGPCFVIQYFDGEDRASFFALTVFLMSCDSQCSVAFPRDANGGTAVCDCGISSSYSLVVQSWTNKYSIKIYLPFTHSWPHSQFSMVTIPASCTFCIKKAMFFIENILSMIMKSVFNNLHVPITLAPILRCLTKVPLTLCMLKIPKWGLWKNDEPDDMPH